MYSYFMPVRVITGEGCLLENPKLCILGKKALIITGRSSGKVSGALADVEKILSEAEIPYSIYDQIDNNPTVECVYNAGLFARKEQADFIIAIGGGSPLDSAKAAAVYAANDIAPMDIYKGSYPHTPLPIAAIPTTAGTGSEVTPYSILTLTEEETKKSFSCPDCFPKIAFLDGRYTTKLPLQTARNTAIDAICHCIEGYMNKKSSPASDYIAIEGLKLFGKHLDGLERGDLTDADRTELLWASTLGGMVISQTGTTIVHSMGYQLTYHKDIPHGMANGLLLGEFMELCADALPEKTARVLAALTLDSLMDLKQRLTRLLPCSITFTEEELERYSAVSIRARNVGTSPKPVTQADELEMLRRSLKK